MAKYKIIIELDENRKSCLKCPFCDPNDICVLQDLDFCDSWDEQLKTCPLELIESEGE